MIVKVLLKILAGVILFLILTLFFAMISFMSDSDTNFLEQMLLVAEILIFIIGICVIIFFLVPWCLNTLFC